MLKGRNRKEKRERKKEERRERGQEERRRKKEGKEGRKEGFRQALRWKQESINKVRQLSAPLLSLPRADKRTQEAD